MPAEGAVLVARDGFRTERDDDLLGIAHQLGSPTTHPRSLANGRIAVATRV